MYRGMTRINLVEDENGDVLANTHSIHSGQKNYLCQLLNVPWVTLSVTVPHHSHQIIPHYMQIFFFKVFLSEWKLGWINDFLIMFCSF